MKIKLWKLMAYAIMIVVVGMSALAPKAQAQGNLTWSQNVGTSGTSVVTALATDNSFAPSALGPVTVYDCHVTLNAGTANINIQNVSPVGPSSAVAYNVTVPLHAGSTGVVFSEWLNPSAVDGSKGSYYDISLNNVPVDGSVIADWTHQRVEMSFLGDVPLFDLRFKREIDAVNGTYETGSSFMLVSSVPEPSVVSLFAIGALLVFFAKNRRLGFR